MVENTEISILMPTYNDSKYLSSAIQSILSQNYRKWELIIVDDGSTDETPKIIESYPDPRITNLRLKENGGQLNALMNGAKLAKGSFITLLHSDDEFTNNHALESNLFAILKTDYQGIFADLLSMNAQSQLQGSVKVADSIDLHSPGKLFLRSGSNIISDVFFVRKMAFNNVLSNYMLWNMPYWLIFNKGIEVLNLKKVHPWYKYRVYPENYLRSDLGKFEVTNGCLRSVIEICSRLDFPSLKLQMVLARALKGHSRPWFKMHPCSASHLREIVAHTIQQYYGKIPENTYFNGLLGFYSNYPSNRTIKMEFKKDDMIFLGKDARAFCTLLNDNSLPEFYVYLLAEAAKGFGKIIVTSKEDYKKAQDSIKFLNLLARIEME